MWRHGCTRVLGGAAVVMTVIAILAGCGGGDSDEAAAADVVSEFLTALAGEDGGRACAQLTAAARQVVSTAATEVPGVSAPECAAVLERIATLIPGGSRAELRRLPEGISADDARIQSDTAIVTVPGARLPIELTNSDRGWLITDQTMRRLLELER